MTKFPGISSSKTQTPQNDINTFQNNFTMKYKLGGQKRGEHSLLFRGGRRIVMMTNYSWAQQLPQWSVGSVDNGLVFCLPCFPPVNYSDLCYQERGLVFLLGVIRVIRGFILLTYFIPRILFNFIFMQERYIMQNRNLESLGFVKSCRENWFYLNSNWQQ